MNKAFHLACAALAVLCTARSQAAPVDIKGRWVIDLPPMIEQARAMKGGDKEIAQLERTFKDGVMVIDARTLKLSVGGIKGEPLSYPYKLVAADPSKPRCIKLAVAALPKPLSMCLDGGVLSVNDPTSALVSTYRRDQPAKAEVKPEGAAKAAAGG